MPASTPPSKTATPDHDILDVLADRWSPRAFSEQPIEPEKIRQVLEAARWAPSSYNRQPWRVFVATKDDPEAYAQLFGCLNENNRRWAHSAPVLLLTVAQHTTDDGKPNRYARHDVGLAMGNLLAQATALGLYVHQMAGILPDEARRTFDIPEGFEPVAGVALGYLGDPETLPEDLRAREQAARTRKPLDEWVFGKTWGATAPVVRE